jgi:hypothetical protein
MSAILKVVAWSEAGMGLASRGLELTTEIVCNLTGKVRDNVRSLGYLGTGKHLAPVCPD